MRTPAGFQRPEKSRVPSPVKAEAAKRYLEILQRWSGVLFTVMGCKCPPPGEGQSYGSEKYLPASAIDAIGDATEDGFDRFHASIGVEKLEWCVAIKGSVWSLQPAGGFGSIAQGIVCQCKDAGETNHAIGFFCGEAGAGGDAAAEGSAGGSDYFGEGAAVHGKLGGYGGKDAGGQAFTDERHQLSWGADGLLEHFLAAKNFGDGRNRHARHSSMSQMPNGTRRLV